MLFSRMRKGEIEVNTTITDKTSLECGEFDLVVSFDIINCTDCIMDKDSDVYNVQWSIGSIYSNGRETSMHVSHIGLFNLKLEFKVRTVCNQNYTYQLFYNIINTQECSGCYSAISYCDLFCNPNPIYDDDCVDDYYETNSTLYPQIPLIWEMKFLDNNGIFSVSSTNNYGIFTFPYYARDEGDYDCPNLRPGLNELVRDLNLFLDLGQTGNPEYQYLSGHVNLMKSYGDITESGDTDLCKIRINFVDMGLFFLGFHEIEQHQFELSTCSVLHQLGDEDEHFDPRFGYDYTCTGWQMQASDSSNSSDYLIETFNKAIEDDERLSSNIVFKPEGEIEYFPTLSSDYFTIKWNANSFHQMTFIIVNTSGKVIKKINNVKNTDYVTIDIRNLTKGLYFIKAMDEDGTISFGKIVKQ